MNVCSEVRESALCIFQWGGNKEGQQEATKKLNANSAPLLAQQDYKSFGSSTTSLFWFLQVSEEF